MSLFKTGLRYFLRRPLQSLLCIFGVALGVAVIVAIDLANGSATRAFAKRPVEMCGDRLGWRQMCGARGLRCDSRSQDV